MPPYTKPLTTPENQLKLLRNRGLIINDAAAAKQALRTIGYYRLKGYMLGFRDLSTPGKKPFDTGTTFEDIMAVVELDRQLRAVLFAGVQHFEPMLRTAMTTELGADYGPTWYADAALFNPVFNHAQALTNWMKDFRKQRHELYVSHFLTKYGLTEYPPSWMMLETVTLGRLSTAYKNGTGSGAARMRIAQHFNAAPENVCVSWLHSVSHLRNVVCHHGRIWGRSFSITPKLPKKSEIRKYKGSSPIRNHFTLAAHVFTLFTMLKAVNPALAVSWLGEFKVVVAGLDDDRLAVLGFKPDWANHPLFN